ncbi:MAG: thioredoxin fold domain-containing protein [Chitinophagaceae bacterium]|nr:thioredoxin fold domain-containing protein [Chitinophagaceae bacterium]
MKKILYLFLLLTGSCIAQDQNGAKTIEVVEYNQLLKENKQAQLIDVRTPGEFAEEHLNQAMNIDFNSPNFKEQVGKLDKSKPVFIYCLSGGRSNSAMSMMKEMGFKSLYNMKGGILQWKSSNLPLTMDNGNPSWKGMTQNEFNNAISGNIPVLVDFNAVWCGPCKQIKPILDDLAKTYSKKLKVMYVDIDVNKSLADEMKIRNIPLMIYYKNGEVVTNIEGFTDKERLISILGL